jgi:23S rRNA (guanine745-N1)-methyltransferase
VCANRHAFDVAKEGYVNFLVGKRPKYAGDTAEMLAARRRFLEAGHYAPLRQRLAEKVAALQPKLVLDAGCGEGYYIGGIVEHLIGSKCLATDIAREGVRLGARRYPEVSFGVADTNGLLPLADGSASVVLDIFAPRNAPEFARILAQAGKLLVVIPTSRHLEELRKLGSLLDIQTDKRQAVEEGMRDYFELADVESLTLSLGLDARTAADLVAMTPNARFLTPERERLLADIGTIKVTAEFELLMFSKIDAP